MPIRVMVVDDHKLMIDGLVGILSEVPEIEIVGQATGVAETLKKLEQLHGQLDVILLDIRMKDGSGIDLMRQIHRKYPHIRGIALTMYDTEEYLSSMLRAGASGYILKNTSREELLQAIQTVHAGNSYFSREAQNIIARQYAQSTRQRAETSHEVQLTPREMDILRLVAKEYTNQQIAQALGISPRTVHTHRRSLIQKLGAKNSAGLVRYAITHNLIDNP
ncbi:MAG: response regulator [Bacteroidia bacterium]